MEILLPKDMLGFDKNTVQLGWSMSKSFTAAMIGVLVKDGKLNINAPAPVPEWKGTKKEKSVYLIYCNKPAVLIILKYIPDPVA